MYNFALIIHIVGVECCKMLILAAE